MIVEFPGSGYLRNARNNVATLVADPADGLVFASAREAADFMHEHAPLVVRLVKTRLRRWDSCIREAGA